MNAANDEAAKRKEAESALSVAAKDAKTFAETAASLRVEREVGPKNVLLLWTLSSRPSAQQLSSTKRQTRAFARNSSLCELKFNHRKQLPGQFNHRRHAPGSENAAGQPLDLVISRQTQMTSGKICSTNVSAWQSCFVQSGRAARRRGRTGTVEGRGPRARGD